MAVCKTCGNNVTFFEIVQGQCRTCRGEGGTTNANTSPEGPPIDIAACSAVALSTEACVPDARAQRLGLVSATCVFGQHLGKDIAGAWRDILGGRAQSIEGVFNDARESALRDLQRAALAKGANAVFAIQVTHQEITGGGKSMVLVTAVGTAVLISPTGPTLSGN